MLANGFEWVWVWGWVYNSMSTT